MTHLLEVCHVLDHATETGPGLKVVHVWSVAYPGFRKGGGDISENGDLPPPPDPGPKLFFPAGLKTLKITVLQEKVRLYAWNCTKTLRG